MEHLIYIYFIVNSFMVGNKYTWSNNIRELVFIALFGCVIIIYKYISVFFALFLDLLDRNQYTSMIPFMYTFYIKKGGFESMKNENYEFFKRYYNNQIKMNRKISIWQCKMIIKRYNIHIHN